MSIMISSLAALALLFGGQEQGAPPEEVAAVVEATPEASAPPASPAPEAGSSYAREETPPAAEAVSVEYRPEPAYASAPEPAYEPVSPPAPRQDFAARQNDEPQRVAPRGSFADTCTGAYVNQGRLYADCRDTRGNVRGTSIELARCSSSDINNSDGLLVCGNVRGEYEGRDNGGRGNGGGNGGGTYGGGSNDGRSGSYTATCSRSRVSQGRLYAECLDGRSRSRSTSIDLSTCARSGDIANDNGLLVCSGGRGRFEDLGGGNSGGNGNGWNGGGSGGWNGGGNWNSITVFTARDYRGDSRTFQGEVFNLGNTYFNDAISSIQVNGPWEICSDSGFRGDCQVIEGNVRNLNNSGLNDRISSMRPLRRGGRW